MIFLILLHSPKGDGVAGIGGQAQLFTSTRSAEANLNRLTWGLTIFFLALTIILSAGWVSPAKIQATPVVAPSQPLNTAPALPLNLPAPNAPQTVPPSIPPTPPQ